MKPQRKDAGGRKSVQHPNYLQPKFSPVQKAVGCGHQEPDSTATNEHAKTDHQPSQNLRLRGMNNHHIRGIHLRSHISGKLDIVALHKRGIHAMDIHHRSYESVSFTPGTFISVPPFYYLQSVERTFHNYFMLAG